MRADGGNENLNIAAPRIFFSKKSNVDLAGLKKFPIWKIRSKSSMLLLFINHAFSVDEFMTELKYLTGLVILEISFLELSFHFFKDSTCYQIFNQRYFSGTFRFDPECMNTKQ